MTQAVRYVRNSAGIAELLLTDDMGDVMRAYGVAGAGMFETIAAKRTGQMAASAEVVVAVEAAPTPRKVAHVVARKSYSAAVEFGTEHQAGHHALAAVADTLEGTA